MGTGFRKCSFSLPDFRVTTSPARSSTRRCFITPKRDISSSDSNSVKVWPSRANSRSSRNRRVVSASALKMRSSSLDTALRYVTIWSHVNERSLLLEEDQRLAQRDPATPRKRQRNRSPCDDEQHAVAGRRGREIRRRRR